MDSDDDEIIEVGGGGGGFTITRLENSKGWANTSENITFNDTTLIASNTITINLNPENMLVSRLVYWLSVDGDNMAELISSGGSSRDIGVFLNEFKKATTTSEGFFNDSDSTYTRIVCSLITDPWDVVAVPFSGTEVQFTDYNTVLFRWNGIGEQLQEIEPVSGPWFNDENTSSSIYGVAVDVYCKGDTGRDYSDITIEYSKDTGDRSFIDLIY